MKKIKKLIAAVLAVICVMGSSPAFTGSLSKSISSDYEMSANAAGFNANLYSYEFADTSVYTTTIYKMSFNVKQEDGTNKDIMAWEDNTYAIYKVVVSHKDESNKTSIDTTEYRIGLYKPNSTTLDFSLGGDVAVPDEVTAYVTDTLKSEITGSNVTVIGDSAFANSYLKTIDLTGVEFIGKKAFQQCSYITEITIPASVKYVGNYTFDSSGLKTLYVQNDMPIIPDNLCSNTQLTKIEFAHPEFIKTVGAGAFKTTPIAAPFFADWYGKDISNYEALEINDSAFEGCTSIKSLKMPENLLYLNKSVFKGCTSLSEIVFGKYTIYADRECFANCTALDSITFNDVLQSLGGGVFSGCTALKYVSDMPNTLQDWVEVTSSTGYGFGNNMFANCTSLISVELPTSITKIPDTVFSGCTSLTAVTMMDNITSIGKSSFNNCIHLLKVDSPKVESVGDSAFNGCAELKKIDFPLTTVIGDNSFKGCVLLDEFNVGECTSVGKNALENCSSLTKITLISDAYGEYVFKNCSSATEINIKCDTMDKTPKGLFSGCAALTSIGGDLSKITIVSPYTFEACSSLANINLSAVRIIENNAFINCTSLKSICENSIAAEDYGAKCFYNCSALNVDVTGTISTIGDSAFQKSGITTVNLNGMTGGTVVIGNSAFADCPNLSAASIMSPENAEFSVGSSVFLNCEKLGNVTYEGPIITSSMFKNCTALSRIYIKATTIQANAFEGCSSLIQVMDRDNTNSGIIAKEIGSAAFKNCKSLIAVASDANTTFTGQENYSGCASIKSVNTSFLTKGMFTDCSSLYDVTLNGITMVPANAFQNCTSLRSIDLTEMLTISAYSFNNTALENVVINNAQTIESNAFSNCTKLNSVTVGAETINSNAFLNDTALKKAVLYVENVKATAFSGCTALTSLVFKTDDSRALETVDSNAFLNCNSLLEVVVPGNPVIDTRAFGYVSGKVNPDYLLVGELGSTVETYANNNKITFWDVNEYIPGQRPQPKFTLGDATEDNKIDAVDASKVLSAYAMIATGHDSGLTSAQESASDVNTDNKVDAVDASIILSYYAYTATGGSNSIETFIKK